LNPLCARCNRRLKPSTPPITLSGKRVYFGPVCVHKLASDRSANQARRHAPRNSAQIELF